MEATVLVAMMRYESIAKKEDFTFETVLSSENKLNILRKAKEEGFFIKCVFVLTVDPQINIARIESRVAAGGHNVDSSKVIQRYYKSINNIKDIPRPDCLFAVMRYSSRSALFVSGAFLIFQLPLTIVLLKSRS